MLRKFAHRMTAIVLSVATEKSDSLRPLQPGDAIDVGTAAGDASAQRQVSSFARGWTSKTSSTFTWASARRSPAKISRGVCLSGRVVEVCADSAEIRRIDLDLANGRDDDRDRSAARISARRNERRRQNPNDRFAARNRRAE